MRAPAPARMYFPAVATYGAVVGLLRVEAVVRCSAHERLVAFSRDPMTVARRHLWCCIDSARGHMTCHAKLVSVRISEVRAIVVFVILRPRGWRTL